jgi:SulP family sulfate permease
MRALLPFGFAAKQALQKGYGFDVLKGDLVAGLIVSLVALPLAMALSIAVGLPPQHGIYTAIVAGIVVPLAGGSVFQVSGPTAAFVVIVAPIVTVFGLRGLIIATILAGFILILLGIFKVGRYIQYIPYPVTTGFTAGIAIVIATLSLNDFLGLQISGFDGSYLEKVYLIITHIPKLYWPEAVIGLLTLLAMVGSSHWLPKIPSPVTGIAFGVLCAACFNYYMIDVATLGSRFPSLQTANDWTFFLPSFALPGVSESALYAFPSFEEIKLLSIPALVIAVLAALESLLSAKVADGMSGTKHQPNAELLGIGLGNILSGLAAGIPATGAIARTATNIKSGAKTPLAAVFHAIFIIGYVMWFVGYMALIPMASLAALLLIVAYHMSHWRQCVRMMSIAPRSDRIVLISCLGFTVLIDMVAGVTVGVILACFLLVKNIARLTQSQISHASTGYHSKITQLSLPDEVMIYHIDGSLFFGTLETVFERIWFIQEQIKTLIIDLENVPLIDMSALVVMHSMIVSVQRNNRTVILCGNAELTKAICHELPPEVIKGIIVYDSLNGALTDYLK